MAISVLKFGGSFLGGIDAADLRQQFLNIADIIKSEQAIGNQVVVVISALAGETRRLQKLSWQLAPQGCLREEDVILAAGEQVTAGLLAKILNSTEINIKARSLLAWQIPILTDESHGNAKIISIETDVIQNLLANDFVVIIPGFQGINAAAEITTLGFEGSDVSAVAISGALNANYCRLYKDVGAVYSANPTRVKLARKIPRISYQDMYVLASLGAKIVHPTAVTTAEKYAVDIHIVPPNSFSNSRPGTIIAAGTAKNDIVGITYRYEHNNLINISVVGKRLFTSDSNEILRLLQKKKVMAEIIETDFSYSSITVQINWLEQLDLCLNTLHNFFFEA